jgi:nucleotide-binding universal stress UspA family protein
MKKILVPTDFSFLANCAMNFATQLAKLESSCIKLLHVIEPPLYKMNSTGEIIKDPLGDVYVLELVAKSKKQLHDILETYCDRKITIEYEVVIGNPANSILDEITSNGINLVIMGSRGASWLDRFLVGSTTEKVVRNAACPVITLKCSIEKVEKLQRIVYAFDSQEDQSLIINELKKLSQPLGAHLYLLRVITPSKFETHRAVTSQLEDFVNKYKLEDYSTHIYTDAKEEEGIMHFAEEVNADLIAMGTNTHTNILQLLTTNLREDIVNHSLRPVWTYNSRLAKHSSADEFDENYTCQL